MQFKKNIKLVVKIQFQVHIM